MIVYYAGLRPIDVKHRNGALPANVLLSFGDITLPESWKIQKRVFAALLRTRRPRKGKGSKP